MKISPPLVVDADTPLSKAVYLVRSSGVGVVVAKGGAYFGMIDERQLAFSPKDTSKAKCSKYAVKAPAISRDTPLLKVVEAFFAGRFKTLPVIEDGEIFGTVSRWDVLDELSGSGMLTGHKVSEYMTTPIVTIKPDATVGHAKALMRENNIRRLIVVDNERISGVISYFDLTRLSFTKALPAPEMRAKASVDNRQVALFMRKKVEVIRKDATLNEAVSKMLSTSVAALIVNDGLVPLGILTTKDILEAVMRNESEGKVFISGLHGFEQSAEDAYDSCTAFVSKLEKSLPIDALNVHVKKTGRQYFVSAHIHGKHRLISTSSGWSLDAALSSSLSELRRQAQKVKTIRLKTRKGG